MEPITRKEMYLATICGDYSGPVPEPVTRMDYYMAYAAGEYSGPLPKPIRQQEFYWAYICGATEFELPYPVTRIDMYLAAICGGMILLPEPITREEIYLTKIAKQSQYVVKSAAGKTIVLTDSLEAPFEDFHIYGHTTQETTTGAQLLDIDAMLNNNLVKNDDGSYSIWKTESNRFSKPINLNIPSGETVRFDADIVDYNGTYNLKLQASFNNGQTIHSDQKIVVNGDISQVSIYQDGYNEVGTYTKFKNAMLYVGDTVLPYEPYTGGLPSPNPDYPQELVSAGDKGGIEVEVLGRQLFDSNASPTEGGDHKSVENNGYLIKNTNHNSYFPIRWEIDVEANTIYVLSFDDMNSNTAILQCSMYNLETEDQIDVFLSNAKKSIVFNSLSNTKLVISFFSNSNTDIDIEVTGAMISKGDTVFPWEPYRTPQTLTLSTPNGLPGIPVTSDGNYTDETGQQWICDEIDFGRGVYVQRIKRITMDGTEDWTVGGLETDLSDRYWICNVADGLNIAYSPVICSDYIYGIISNSRPSPESGACITWMNIRIRDNSFDDIDAWKTRLANHNVTVQYILATPIETPLSVSELAAYQALHTNSPTTVIKNDENCWMAADYRSKPVS